MDGAAMPESFRKRNTWPASSWLNALSATTCHWELESSIWLAELSASPALLSFMKKSLVLLSKNTCSTNWRHYRFSINSNNASIFRTMAITDPVNKAFMKFIKVYTRNYMGDSIMYENNVFKVTILFQKIKMGFAQIQDILPTFNSRNNSTDRQKNNIW